TIERHDGELFSTMGDGIAAVFASAVDALNAARAVQQQLAELEQADGTQLRARIGVHTDEGRLRAPREDVNRPINPRARLTAAPRGGQARVAGTAAARARASWPGGPAVMGLGEQQLRAMGAPLRVFQRVYPKLIATFPPLRTLDSVPGNIPRDVASFVGRERE